MTRTVPRLLLLLGALLVAAPAYGARTAVVETDRVELREGPGPTYKAIDKLPKGTPLAASNQPIEGYYKVRTGAGVIGFVPADALSLQPTPAEDSPVSAEAPPPASGIAPSDAYKPTVTNESPFRNRPRRRYLRLKGFGGYNFFSVGDVNNLFSANVLQFGFNAGGEVDFLFTPDIALVIRQERVFKSVFGQDQSTHKSFQMDLTSYPLMAGLELTLTGDSKITSHFTVMAGLGLITDLTSQDLSDPTPNVTDMTSTTFTGVAKFDFTYNFNKTFGLFAEGGYRYLKTAQIVPGQSVNGSQIFQDKNNNNAFIPVSLDLSGPFVGLGLSLSL